MTITVRFHSDDARERRFSSADPVRIGDAAALCGLDLEFPCGGQGRCTGCRIQFTEGAPPITPADHERLDEDRLASGWRLACQAVVAADALVEVPRNSRSVPSKSFGPERLRAPGQRPDLTPGSCGFAIDAGTTTLAVALVDLTTTEVLAADSTLNPQVRFGPDVIARIHSIRGWSHGDARLAAALREGLAWLAEAVSAAARIEPERIIDAVVCGNAFISHTLAGEPVQGLGEAPYVGTFVEPRALPFTTLGLPGRAGARARLMPQVRSHVGGDAVAAMLAVELREQRRPQLLIDLGTNTEIVATDGTRIVAASAAAGPAFEGGGITFGMRATDGAIDRVSRDPAGHLTTRVIGGGDARGLCGTGLCDAVAALLDAGVVDASGRMRRPADVEPHDPLRDALVDAPRGGHGARLGTGREGDVVITARDVRQLQLVKGAIAAGAEHLLRRLGLRSDELTAVYLAGAFGNVLRKETAVRIGILPPVDPECVHAVGDAAAAGARLALCSPDAFDRAAALAGAVEHVELARDPDYADRFAHAMRFPGGAV